MEYRDERILVLARRAARDAAEFSAADAFAETGYETDQLELEAVYYLALSETGPEESDRRAVAELAQHLRGLGVRVSRCGPVAASPEELRRQAGQKTDAERHAQVLAILSEILRLLLEDHDGRVRRTSRVFALLESIEDSARLAARPATEG